MSIVSVCCKCLASIPSQKCVKMISSQKCVKIASFSKVCQSDSFSKVCQNRQTLQKPNKLFCYVVFYVKILVLVRILDEFQKCDCDLGPAGGPDHGTLCVSSGPPLLTPMRTLRSKLLLGKNHWFYIQNGF